MAKTRRRAYQPRNEEQNDRKYGKRGNARSSQQGDGKGKKGKKQ